MNSQDFMTKTQYISRDNKSPADDVYLIAMDIGYSAVKVFSPEAVAMFPSYAVRDTGYGTAGTLTSDYIRYENLDTGEKWFVGNMAQDGLSDDDTSVSETSLYGRDRYRDPMFAVIAETGLGIACMYSKGIYKNRKVCLQTGLPPRYTGKGSPDARDLTDLLSGTHRFSLRLGQDKVHQIPLGGPGVLFRGAAVERHGALLHALLDQAAGERRENAREESVDPFSALLGC